MPTQRDFLPMDVEQIDKLVMPEVFKSESVQKFNAGNITFLPRPPSLLHVQQACDHIPRFDSTCKMS